MITWKVVYTEQAEQDLKDIYEYISFSLLSPENARGQVKRIINDIAKLDNVPMRHALDEKEPWHSKGLRFMPVNNFIVFYQPIETQSVVAIIRIMYSGRNIDEQLPEN